MRQVLIAGRYRLLDLVGRGGMGRVWRARDEMLHRDVAVKQVVPPSWLADDERAELRSRTLREARTAARLNHPNVVRLYDVVQVDGDPWIVMEYVPSRTLQDVLDGEGPLDPRRAARIGLAVLAALRAAHTAGVLHRDVKPQNVLVAYDGRVLLTDFGLATFDGGDGVMTRPGLVLGSPQYVSPERAAEGVSSVEADLWSLGATLHAAVEGRSPYARSTAMATLTALATAPPDPAPHAGPLEPVLTGLLRREPGDRVGHDEARRRLTAAAAAPPGDGLVAAPTVDRPAAPDAGGRGTGQAAPAGVAAPESTGPAGGAPPPPVDGPPPSGGSGSTARTTAGTDTGRAIRSWNGRLARRVGLVSTALLVAAAAGIGTALTVTGDGPDADQAGSRATGQPTDRWGQPPERPYGEPGGPGGPRPGEPPGPRPGGRDVPPPPFPCVRPDIWGEPVPAGTPAPGERFRPPRGWSWYGDAMGFRLALPAGWRYSREGGVTCFQDPSTGRALSVTGPHSGDPNERLRGVRDRASEIGALPDYHEVRLGPVDGDTAWEARWTTPHGTRQHAELRVPARPPEAARWTLGWITADPDWTAARRDWSTLRASFRPPG
ncbi:serine/threonine-protein kinase [Micromonospora krabiensis]|uniref:non-specific serine/threonine protein kinase n=1 Tax=Micromonospora krabiensis TaxID=307121 RepID=A0A1C3NE32_9ACTN|nr:serine/threonine-protein kinase [Micromonospora krabiensis]SBV30845.1 Serine/threonine protein kinase [Micromonospora krabiensis]